MLGAMLSNVEAAPVALPALRAEHVCESGAALTWRVAGHYINGLVPQLYKILGSVDVFGNPTVRARVRVARAG